MTAEESYMYRCFQLARLGIGNVAPNPMVGCVIVSENKIIGEGYHQQFGQAHAEVNAIASVEDKNALTHSTLYVNLEPCSHYGKTPPCADLIIKYGIPKVIICNTDPNPQVSGNGIKKLREAGIQVEQGLLEDKGLLLNRHFFTFHTKKRPFILLKWAESKDGFLDGKEENPIQISNEITKTLVHKLRAEEMAILVGTKTALKDNPKLLTRRWSGKNPIRIAIDKTLKIPSHYKLLDRQAETIIFNAIKNEEGNPLFIKLNFEKNIIPQILDYLYKNNINSLIVEGGKQVLESFLELGLYDEIQKEISDFCLYEGTKAPCVRAAINSIHCFGNNKIITYCQ